MLKIPQLSTDWIARACTQFGGTPHQQSITIRHSLPAPGDTVPLYLPIAYTYDDATETLTITWTLSPYSWSEIGEQLIRQETQAPVTLTCSTVPSQECVPVQMLATDEERARYHDSVLDRLVCWSTLESHRFWIHERFDAPESLDDSDLHEYGYYVDVQAFSWSIVPKTHLDADIAAYALLA